MQYTKQQLDEMSDHDIDLAVSRKINAIYQGNGIKSSYFEITIHNGLNSSDLRFNPCESWGAVMPIAEKYEMKLDFNGIDCEVMATEPCCDTYRVLAQSSNKNPRRAICEVFLMMEE